MEAHYLITDIGWGVVLTVLGVALPFFVYFRNSPYIKQRDYILLGSFWLLSIPWITRFRFNTIDEVNGGHGSWIPCEQVVWFGNLIYVFWTNMMIVRMIRLLLIFNITKWKFTNEQNDETIEKPFWCDEKYYSRKYLLILFAILNGVFSLFVFPGAIYSVITGVCTLDLVTTPATLLAASMDSVAIFLFWKLRHVHDAYGVKTEFKIIGFLGLLSIPLIILLFVTNWAWVFGFLVGSSWVVASFTVPLYFVFKERYRQYSSSSSDESVIQEEELHGDDQTPVESKSLLLCSDPHYKKYFRDFSGLAPFLEQYILHFQEVTLSHQLLFAIHIIKFKELPNSEMLTGKAYLIVQKFLAENAYVHIEDVNPQLRQKIVQKIASAVHSVEANWDPDAPAAPITSVTNDVFDELFETVKANLLTQLFKPFFKSEFFKEFLNKQTLKDGLENV
jgi:hypothetical protein